MIAKRAIGERGQFVVPKDVREQLGLHPGTEVTVDVKDGKILFPLVCDQWRLALIA